MPMSETDAPLTVIVSDILLPLDCRPIELMAAACGRQVFVWSLRGKAHSLQVMPVLILRKNCCNQLHHQHQMIQ